MDRGALQATALFGEFVRQNQVDLYRPLSGRSALGQLQIFRLEFSIDLDRPSIGCGFTIHRNDSRNTRRRLCESRSGQIETRHRETRVKGSLDQIRRTDGSGLAVQLYRTAARNVGRNRKRKS